MRPFSITNFKLCKNILPFLGTKENCKIFQIKIKIEIKLWLQREDILNFMKSVTELLKLFNTKINQ